MRSERELAAGALTLARRFAAGATLWCWARDAPHHAQHVAVEFVHPVVVGARALPAVAAATEATVRNNAAKGDVVLAIGASAGFDPADLGVTVLTLAADNLFDGSVVRQYHVLWELTQVCLEHPGLLRDE